MPSVYNIYIYIYSFSHPLFITTTTRRKRKEKICLQLHRKTALAGQPCLPPTKVALFSFACRAVRPVRLQSMQDKKGSTDTDLLVDRSVVDEFEEMTNKAEDVQRETLRKILEENEDSEYLIKSGLNGRTDPLSFKDCLPLVCHQDLEPYINRILEGDTSLILTGKPVTSLSLSSGTTQGRPKFVPFNDQLFETTIQVYKSSFAYRNREYPIGEGKALQFLYSSKPFTTKGGITAGTATTNLFRHPSYKSMMQSISSESCSPEEVIFGPDFHQSLYCHLLCGLIHRHQINFIFSTFAHSLVQAFESFEHLWPELCADIRDGSLSTKRVSARPVRDAMARLLPRPNPELARSVQDICLRLRDKGWKGLLPELFPNARYVYGILTGSMEPYLKKLRGYSGENLPLIAADYGASEGWIAINVEPKLPPEEATFVVVPNIGYFEFLPLSTGDGASTDHQEETVGLTEVQIGQDYEVIITNFAGLYRYKLGDVVKVVGFHNSSPALKFVCRRNLLLTINIDKTTEKDLHLAVERAAEKLYSSHNKLDLVDFTSQVDRSTDPGHYVIFWELSGGSDDDRLLELDDAVLQECSNCLERSFVDAGYVSSRKVGGIGALELRIVRRGTFDKVQEHYLGLGTTANQFKTPRCMGPNNKAVLQILHTGVVKTYFSTAYQTYQIPDLDC